MPRNRVPTVLANLHGNPSKRRPRDCEPQPPPGTPAPPAHLSERARAVWPRAATTLCAMGVLTVADGLGLEGLVEAVADLQAARASLAAPVKAGRKRVAAGGSPTYVTVGKSGPMIRARPELALIADADRRVAMWLAKFGLTPADRSRVGGELAPPAFGQLTSRGAAADFDAFLASKPTVHPTTLDEFLATDPDAPRNAAPVSRRSTRRRVQ